jgi:hypothetical protein
MADTRDRAYYKNLKCKNALKACRASIPQNHNAPIDAITKASSLCSKAAHYHYCGIKGDVHDCGLAVLKCVGASSGSSPIKCGDTGQDDRKPEVLRHLHEVGQGVDHAFACYDAAYTCYQVALQGRNHDTFEKLHP